MTVIRITLLHKSVEARDFRICKATIVQINMLADLISEMFLFLAIHHFILLFRLSLEWMTD